MTDERGTRDIKKKGTRPGLMFVERKSRWNTQTCASAVIARTCVLTQTRNGSGPKTICYTSVFPSIVRGVVRMLGRVQKVFFAILVALTRMACCCGRWRCQWAR